MKIYSYVIDHDLGLAPNPFGGYCTLAVCKPKIRKSNNLAIGDWIIGTGSKSLEKTTNKEYVNHLIYAMKVSEKVPLQDYWLDERFQYKKPNINGSLVTMYGDNIYHIENDEWIQENSAHSNIDGSTNYKHLKKDISGLNVLIGSIFYYFGKNAPLLPQNLENVCKNSVGEKFVPKELETIFLNWLTNNYKPGIYGDPISWILHNQLKLFI